MLSALQGYGACGRAQMRGIPDMYALEGGIPLKGYGNSVGIQAKDSFDIPKTVAQENIPSGRKRKGVQGKAEGNGLTLTRCLAAFNELQEAFHRFFCRDVLLYTFLATIERHLSARSSYITIVGISHFTRTIHNTSHDGYL